MKQHEIEEQILDVLKGKAKEVSVSQGYVSDGGEIGVTGFGLASIRGKEEVPIKPERTYHHSLFATKPCHDWKCAALRLYRFCESLPVTERMFIRRVPKIEKTYDFERMCTTWRGTVRFAIT